MSNLRQRSRGDSSPEQIRCDKAGLILALTKASQSWEKLDIVDATLEKCGLDPFFEVLDIPKNGILGEDIQKASRRGHDNSLIRALSIQAFGKIPDLVKKGEVAALRHDVSRNLLTVLKEEAIHGDTTLIKWSASIAIKSIWYDDEWQKQGKFYSVNAGIDAPRLEQKIIEDQINPLISNRPVQRYSQRGYGLNFSSDYEDYLDFWVYGPTWELFNLQLNSEDYQFLVQTVLNRLLFRGVSLGFKATNYLVLEKSLELAERLFDQFEFSQILTAVSKFLQHPEIRLRDKATQMLKPYEDKLDKKSSCIFKALTFYFSKKAPTFYFSKEHTLWESLTITEIDQRIIATEQYKEEIGNIFESAKLSCDLNKTEVKEFFSAQMKNYQNNLTQYINSLEKQADFISSYKALLRENYQLISTSICTLKQANTEIYNNLLLKNPELKLTECSEPSTSEQCNQINEQLTSFKNSIDSCLNKVKRDLVSEFFDLRSDAHSLKGDAKDLLKCAGITFVCGILLQVSGWWAIPVILILVYLLFWCYGRFG